MFTVQCSVLYPVLALRMTSLFSPKSEGSFCESHTSRLLLRRLLRTISVKAIGMTYLKCYHGGGNKVMPSSTACCHRPMLDSSRGFRYAQCLSFMLILHCINQPVTPGSFTLIVNQHEIDRLFWMRPLFLKHANHMHSLSLSYSTIHIVVKCGTAAVPGRPPSSLRFYEF